MYEDIDIEIAIDDAGPQLETGVAFLDVRDPDELLSGYIEGAIALPLDQLLAGDHRGLPSHDEPIIIYCSVGARSRVAVEYLRERGYSQAMNLAGGIEAWQRAGLPIAAPATDDPTLSPRYSRHTRIPEIGLDGQRRLLNSRVLIIGAGGLGSPAALYLAAAGVGTIGIVDDDVVDLSNLQRQILHTTASVGASKLTSAEQTLAALNPDVRVITHAVHLDVGTAADIVAGYDVVLDGSDNFETRYALNDACVQLGIPYIHGSIYRFDGQVTVFDPRDVDSPCYRCLFPEAPPLALAPNCAVAGVLGLLPGVIGTLQATEAVKLLLGIGESLVGRLLIYDALSMTFHTLPIRRNPNCWCAAHRH